MRLPPPRPSSRGIIYASERALNAQDAFDILLIGAPTHAGEGEYVIEFSTRPGVAFGTNSKGEPFRPGTLRFGRHADVLFAGENPY